MHVYFQNQKRLVKKPLNEKKKKTGGQQKKLKSKGQPKKKAGRTRLKKMNSHPISSKNIRSKLVNSALKTAETMRAEEKSEKAANVVYGNNENIGIQ